jgi:hypothetical protein
VYVIGDIGQTPSVLRAGVIWGRRGAMWWMVACDMSAPGNNTALRPNAALPLGVGVASGPCCGRKPACSISQPIKAEILCMTVPLHLHQHMYDRQLPVPLSLSESSEEDSRHSWDYAAAWHQNSKYFPTFLSITPPLCLLTAVFYNLSKVDSKLLIVTHCTHEPV